MSKDTIFERFKDDQQKGILVEALAMMVWQHCTEVDEVYISGGVTSDRCAMDSLVNFGVAAYEGEPNGRQAKIKFNVEVFP